MKLHSKGFFKHSGQWHILPLPNVIIEPLNSEFLLTFEISFLEWTAYITYSI